MRHLHFWTLLGLLLTALAVRAQPGLRRDGELKEGSAAPDFTIKDVAGKQTVKLSALKGKPVVLILGSCT
jgi:cytochrome oxidase Cu insertion factor (SCO1/SenC/PrrC family)